VECVAQIPKGVHKCMRCQESGQGLPHCGGIDLYTLVASHGLRQTRWPNSPERVARFSELLGEPYGASRDYLMIKEIKSVRIDIVSFVDTAVVISWD
jgi:hypothetical protein